MTEVGPADRTRLLRSRRDEFKCVLTPLDRARSSDSNETIFALLTHASSIVTSRKRKLRELYDVATPDHGGPNAASANYDAPTPSQAELQFLHHCDILKYVRPSEINTLPGYSPPRATLSRRRHVTNTL